MPMARNFIERRVVARGLAASARRAELGEEQLAVEDLGALEIKTFSPWLQGFYILVGLCFAAFGIWVNIQTRSMVQSVLPVLFGVANIAFALYGRPVEAGKIEGLDLSELLEEIRSRFHSTPSKGRSN